MDILNSLKAKLDIKNEELDEITFEIEKMNKRLKEEGILLNEQFKIGLYSHMVSFIRRLRSGEKVMAISDEILAQLDKESMELAMTILKPLFEKYDIPVDMSEIALVAIHIQAAKEYCLERGEIDG